MNQSDLNAASKPWYRHPYVWMLIAIPLCAVIGGIVMLRLAIVTSDGLVVDDYYQRGKEINQVLERDRRAAAMGVEGIVELDHARDRVRLRLSGGEGFSPPTEVELAILHPTRAGRDHRVVLSAVGESSYEGALPLLERAEWDLQIQAQDWRLTGTLEVPTFDTVHIVAQPAG
jgi:hypothetical protein